MNFASDLGPRQPVHRVGEGSGLATELRGKPLVRPAPLQHLVQRRPIGLEVSCLRSPSAISSSKVRWRPGRRCIEPRPASDQLGSESAVFLMDGRHLVLHGASAPPGHGSCPQSHSRFRGPDPGVLLPPAGLLFASDRIMTFLYPLRIHILAICTILRVANEGATVRRWLEC
jgi:hypothetical protein